MKILLTGATGFLGARLLEYLLKKNYQVIIIKRQSTNLKPLVERFGKLEAWDCEDDELDNLFRVHHDVDVIAHAATDYGRNGSSPTATFWTNEVFPVKLLELAIQHKVKLFVNMDTFFNTQKAEYDYLGAYTLSKRHFQEWGKYCGDAGRIRFVNLRLFHLYGSGDGSGKFVPAIVRRCLADEEIDLTDGEQRRDFIHVDDAVAAVGVVFEAELPQGAGYRHYDVGTGTSIRVRDFVESVKKLCGGNAKLNFGALPNRKGEFQDSSADTEALRAIGWKPKINIDAGIIEVIEHIGRHALQNSDTNKK
ncbi:UDP-glucose 4-epimerase [mine drainage metagenome]|uniref:UDP-glucose 4-epimerase n=1 Tax=mine drainage metagenome TaxID=410659 RepID=A0A1J5T396_9ZZZZ